MSFEANDVVRIWDENGKEASVDDAETWDSWDKCYVAPGFPKGLVQFLRDTERGCAFPAPTRIQAYSWPALVTGKDLIGVAKTGSGKTLAFLLPGFMWLKRQRKAANPIDTNVGPGILTLTPTRELCYQIYSDADKFGTPVKISAACAYGGAPKWEQEKAFGSKPEVLIATPGRLADFVRNRAVSLDMARYLVLDEADRMLDMGFEKQVKEILDFCPKERQVAMFTATWGKEVRKLADQYIYYPVHVQVGSMETSANHDIEQHIHVVNGESEKKEELKQLLDEFQGSCLVFCNTKKKCRDLAYEFWKQGAVELHGDLDQKKRDEAMKKFRDGEAKVMIATDIAARGLDMRDVRYVVNYDAPNNCSEDYVHRIGRTGRAGDKGDAYTFLTWGEDSKAQDIKKIMENGGQTPPEILVQLANGKFSAGSGSTAGDKDEKWNTKDDKDKWWEKKDDKSWDKKDSWDSKGDDKWGKKDDAWWKKDDKKDDKNGGDKWWEKKDDKWGKKDDDGDKWWEKKNGGDKRWEKKDEAKEDSWSKKDGGGGKWWEKKEEAAAEDDDGKPDAADALVKSFWAQDDAEAAVDEEMLEEGAEEEMGDVIPGSPDDFAEDAEEEEVDARPTKAARLS
eukprot:TRINITY_DN4089_c0_g2_i3.p1 TRINITY_DN4089_c0_g2~~TRINITY_DN4089_c0_g2_i3.p1  ORF type:complete len:622 (-),score=205.29 TRINITY_DN4089_c0_g2_i3:212-2077(-)